MPRFVNQHRRDNIGKPNTQKQSQRLADSINWNSRAASCAPGREDKKDEDINNCRAGLMELLPASRREEDYDTIETIP